MVRNRVSVSFSFASFSFTIYHAPRVVHVNPYRHSAPYSQCVPSYIQLNNTCSLGEKINEKKLKNNLHYAV